VWVFCRAFVSLLAGQGRLQVAVRGQARREREGVMKRVSKALLLSSAVVAAVAGTAAPAFAGDYCPPPPVQCEWRPGWGGLGAVHSPEADAYGVPGGGAGDQNHCHSGPPGLGLPRYD
jgi:hypothetical protein